MHVMHSQTGRHHMSFMRPQQDMPAKVPGPNSGTNHNSNYNLGFKPYF